MAKSKAPTPQELYRRRREEEAQALLPPGLINHGNTCFMNSVLQGLIATPMLAEMASAPPADAPASALSPAMLAARRSPQLTNGHALGGAHEQEWVDEMPLGDVFIDVMQKAWEVQRSRKRESMSPKIILATIGKKYDQYLDFAQQDAHEFLRQLLDAMRMEELDVIKKRQPPPPPDKHKKRRRLTITSPNPLASPTPDGAASPPPEEKLMSFADMLFGGKLTSILVCQKCKRVSQTYEDFNDLSLSLKPEDYAREKKRDLLKSLAKKLTSLPSASLAVGAGAGSGEHRSSSVPPTPREREDTHLGGHDDPPISGEPRRRSLDIMSEPDSAEKESVEKDYFGSPPMPEAPHTADGGSQGSSHVEFLKQEKPERKEKKDDDGWTRLGRRLSMSVGLRKSSKERKSRSRPTSPSESTREAKEVKEIREIKEIKEKDFTADITQSPIPLPSTPRMSLSDVVAERVNHRAADRPASPGWRSRPRSRPQSLSPLISGSPFPTPSHPTKRAKSPHIPKPSAAEREYLRQILADITPASPNPLALLKSASASTAGFAAAQHAMAQNLWTKLGQLPSVEECLRMFTAVEIMDGENMVGCRRCWKIEHGLYVPRHSNAEGGDDDSDAEEDEKSAQSPPPEPKGLATPEMAPAVRSRPPSPLSSPINTPKPVSISSPVLPSSYEHPVLNDDESVSSLPLAGTSISDSETTSLTSLSANASVEHLGSAVSFSATPGGLPIPLISTTAPESPLTARPPYVDYHGQEHPGTVPDKFNIDDPALGDDADDAETERQNRLRAPSRGRRAKGDAESTSSSSDTESDTSGSASLYSTGSSTSVVSPRPSPTLAPRSPPTPRAPARKARVKETVLRPAFKRYLIAVPPPVLVIHFKRFQQLAKAPLLSFSHGFKKIDDFVTFPEYLDLTPFLAPKKEDFGLGRRGVFRKHRAGAGGRERCVYRLYAVVMHIGNMLGGHYVAYTALPPNASSTPGPSPTSSTDRVAQKQAPRQWAYISDTVVRLSSLEEVLKAKAYLCMYERV